MTIKSELEFAEKVLEKTLKAGADEVDIVLASAFETSCGVRLGNIENIEVSESTDIGLRVLLKGKKGYKTANISTNSLTEQNIDKAIYRLIETAKSNEEDEHTKLAKESEYAKKIDDLKIYSNKEVSADTLKEWALEAEDAALKVKGITNSEGAGAAYNNAHFILLTSKGFVGEYRTSGYTCSASVIAADDNGMETDYDYSYVHDVNDLAKPSEIGLSAAKQAVKKLSPRKIRTCKVPIVFDPKVAKSLLGVITSSINGNAIVKKSSFLSEKLGEQILPKNLSIYDNPLLPKGLSSQPFDAEGIRGENMTIVENGVLKNWILDIRSGSKLGLQSNGRAARSVSSSPSPTSTNVYLSEGERSPQEIISEIKQGLYLTDLFGMGVNAVTGDFSQGAAGFWIENGEIQYPVSEITVAGKLLDMFKNMEAANDLTFRYSKNSPTIRIDNMTVAGS